MYSLIAIHDRVSSWAGMATLSSGGGLAHVQRNLDAYMVTHAGGGRAREWRAHPVGPGGTREVWCALWRAADFAGQLAAAREARSRTALRDMDIHVAEPRRESTRVNGEIPGITPRWTFR